MNRFEECNLVAGMRILRYRRRVLRYCNGLAAEFYFDDDVVEDVVERLEDLRALERCKNSVRG
jgi:hypothetical protein